MKKSAVHLGERYIAKVSGNLVPVRIDAENPHGGWTATNTETGRKVRIKSAQRLRRAVGPAQASPELQAAIAERVGRVEDGLRETVEACQAGNLAEGIEIPRRAKAYDPDRCATPRCKGEPALTYLGKPLCQKCWDRQSAEPSEMLTEGAVPLAEALATSPIAAANEASWKRAQPGPDDVGNGDEHENADDQSASTGDAGELETEDMAMKTKKSGSKKGKGRKGATKSPTPPKPKAAAKVEASAKRQAKAATNGESKPKRVSALDAAAQVLRSAKAPMRPREIIEAAASKGLWTSPAGKTPHATLDAAMRREINTKGKDARFTIEGRGLFGFNGEGK